jgi:hypothetical protein
MAAPFAIVAETGVTTGMREKFQGWVELSGNDLTLLKSGAAIQPLLSYDSAVINIVIGDVKQQLFLSAGESAARYHQAFAMVHIPIRMNPDPAIQARYLGLT